MLSGILALTLGVAMRLVPVRSFSIVGLCLVLLAPGVAIASGMTSSGVPPTTVPPTVVVAAPQDASSPALVPSSVVKPAAQVGSSPTPAPDAVELAPPNDLSSTPSEPGQATPRPSAPRSPTVATVSAAAIAPVRSGFDPATSTEVPSSRSVGSKTYQNRDGSMTAVLSTEAVNYKSPKGEWLPVDNHLVVDKAGVVRNAANDWSVSFGSLADGVGLDTGRGVLGWRAQSAQDVLPVIEPDGVSLRYVNAWPGVDLVYRVSGSTVARHRRFRICGAANGELFVPSSRIGLLPGHLEWQHPAGHEWVASRG